VKRLLVGFAVVCGTIALFATPAFAHATIQGSEPAQSASLPSGSPPRAVTVRFDQPVTVSADSIQVFDGSGKRVKTGAVVSGKTADEITAPLPRLGDGTYVVTWRVVSSDSHPVQGAFTFGVGAAAGSSADIQGLLAKSAGDRTVGLLFGLDRALAFLGTLVLVGGLAFVRWWWPDASVRRDITRLLLLAAVVTVVSALAGIALQGAYASGGGLSTVLDWSQIRAVLHTHFGKAWLLRAFLALGLLAFARLVPRRGRAGLLGDVLFAGLGILTLETFTYAGHGNTGRWVPLGTAADLAHLGGAALWLGGLVVVAWGLRDPEQPRGAAGAVERFSQVALPAIVVVVLSGTVQAWRQVGTWWALWHTTYARLLVAKVIVVGAVVVAAYASRDVLRFHVAPALRAAVGPGALRREAASADVRELRNGIWVEVALAVVIVSITAALVNAQPAREAAAATPRTFHAVLHTPDIAFDVEVQPALPGDDTVVVTPRFVKDPNGQVLQLDASMSLAGRVARIPMAFAPLARGRYVATVQVPFSGDWTFQVRALRTQIDESVALTQIRIG
jgi:copper transport protein